MNVNEASSDSGLGAELSPLEDDIITPEMVKEEAKLAKRNEELMEKERRRIEKELSDEVLREQSKKRLINLLEKSKFYANFMRDRIVDHEKKVAKNKRRPAANRKKLNADKYSEEITSTLAKRKGDASKTALHDVTNMPSSSGIIPEKASTRITSMGIEVSDEQPVLLEGACMRDYQLEGFKWLKSLFEGGMNGILADEMGLGKTIQAISLICHLYDNGVHGPILIVAPLSTLPNWVREFEVFAPKLPVVLYHGSKVARQQMCKTLLKEVNFIGKKVFPVIITSYEVPWMDVNILGPVTWKYIIVDEGHRIKNFRSRLARTLGGFRSINRLLLTGTPLQNDLTELWSLLHFILPEIFDSLDIFETLFTAEELAHDGNADACLEREEKSNILTLLHEVLTPFLLRRLKSDVELKIPPKKEILVRCPMTKIQLDLYQAVLDKSILIHSKHRQLPSGVIPEGPNGLKRKRYSKYRDPQECLPAEEDDGEVLTFGKNNYQYRLNVKMTTPHIALIKILNHPYLIHPKVLPGSNFMDVDEEIMESSGKMTILDGLLRRLNDRGHKVLIFSTYTTMLNIIEEYAIMIGYNYRRLDGGTNLQDRMTAMCDFNTDPNIFLFLISTRAGGLGINLTSADTVIIYNSDWNPQADLQAQDRCHRIGQTKPVIVYRFMVPGTFDERIVSRAGSKRKLEKMVIQKGKFKHGLQDDVSLTLQEIKALLNEKQHNLDVQPNGTMFTDEQWESLLDRSELVIPSVNVNKESVPQETTTAQGTQQNQENVE